LRHFTIYFTLGSALGAVSAGLTQAVASGRSLHAALLDMVLTGAGMLACQALIDRRWVAVVAYVLGGGFGTWMVC